MIVPAGVKSGFRAGLRSLCVNPIFDNGILICIIVSSARLSPNQDRRLSHVLRDANQGFATLFALECILYQVVKNYAKSCAG